jgi:hypothetical protein
MLVLPRRHDEKIVLPGLGITAQVLDVRHGHGRRNFVASSVLDDSRCGQDGRPGRGRRRGCR